MKFFRFPWQFQMIFSLLLGLVMGELFSLQPKILPEPPQTWFVQLRIAQDAPPVFEKVQPGATNALEPPATPGDSSLELLDAGGKTLWSKTFAVSFSSEDLPSPMPYRIFSFIVPALPGAASLRVITPTGEAVYDLP